MADLKFIYPPGATPLDPDESAGLIPDYVSTQGELNVLEQENIVEAHAWARKKVHGDILNVSFALELHKQMFGRVWKWAGRPRVSNKNIGVSHEQINAKLSALLKDTDHWIKNQTYNWDEIGARFHHRLVSIHVFSNGNGRHARLMTDILLEKYRQSPFTWGATQSSLEVQSTVRKNYISALKSADQGDLKELIRFVRS